MISPAATIKTYGRLVEEVAIHVGRRGIPVLRSTYSGINDLLEQRKIDCAFVCTGAYLAGKRRFGMTALLVPVFHGTPTYNSVIIVRKDSGIRNFESLRGKTFAFVDPLSNTGRYYPVSRVLDLGSTPEEFFHFQYTHSHDKSIRAVHAGVFAGAAVDELVYEHMKRSESEEIDGLTIIERSPTYGAPPVVVHPDTSATLRSELRRAFLDLDSHVEGRAILENLGIDGFIVPPKGLYDSVAALEEKVRGHDGRKRRR